MVRKEIEARENEELEKIVELFEKAKNKKHMIQFLPYEPRFVEVIKWLKDYLRIKKGGWIPAIERLPEEDGRYLVTFKYGIKVCMVGYGSCKRTVLGYPIGHGWYSLEEAQYYAEDSIIAWQPLPKPYKED